MTLVAAPRQIGATCERQHVQKRIGPWLRTGGREAEPGRDVDGTFEGGEILFRTAHFGCPTKSGLRRSQRPARQPPELWDVPEQNSADGMESRTTRTRRRPGRLLVPYRASVPAFTDLIGGRTKHRGASVTETFWLRVLASDVGKFLLPFGRPFGLPQRPLYGATPLAQALVAASRPHHLGHRLAASEFRLRTRQAAQ